MTWKCELKGLTKSSGSIGRVQLPGFATDRGVEHILATNHDDWLCC